jgi:hypothetical protein
MPLIVVGAGLRASRLGAIAPPPSDQPMKRSAVSVANQSWSPVVRHGRGACRKARGGIAVFHYCRRWRLWRRRSVARQ